MECNNLLKKSVLIFSVLHGQWNIYQSSCGSHSQNRQ